MNTWSLNNPNLQKTTLYSPDQYDNPESSPPDTICAPAYRKKISLDHPVYKLAPEVALNQVGAEL